MGQIVQLICDCGYESKDLFLGSGMLEGPERVAATCGHCSAIVAVATGKRIRCPKCGRKPELLAPALADVPYGEAPPKYGCPRCGKPSLQVGSIGMWD